jgi:hypothetical protein
MAVQLRRERDLDVRVGRSEFGEPRLNDQTLFLFVSVNVVRALLLRLFIVYPIKDDGIAPRSNYHRS